ncbi:BatA domain-containing protein [Algoriphagus mannitolivorans]|uniref:BatA domain-containing protein n=1 Tax=Algoriphagus mannitolivorans TaxID=226504 RepID=UPI0004266735|nr:BatA domain-containing protein [Algoriphagus mannitolivorans]
MTWVTPVFFWGLLGISVPILIHLWSGRKGKVISWAATAWLNPQESQSSRSLKLDHRLLLLVRILLWIALILLLVGIWWKGFLTSEEKAIVHGVAPDEKVAAEFRFELNQAQERGERVVWLSEGLPLFDLEAKGLEGFDPNGLQSYLDELMAYSDAVHLYMKGLSDEFSQSSYWINSEPIFHLSQTVKPKHSGFSIQLDSGRFLGINTEGFLETKEQNAYRQVALISPISVNLENVEVGKKEILKASLEAITEVYGLQFSESNLPDAKIIFTSGQDIESSENQLVLRTESLGKHALSNPVQQPWEEVVQKGVLPELILKKVLPHFGIDPDSRKLSQAQIAQKFHRIPESKVAKISNSSEIILLLILALFGLERFLAFRSNQ